MSSSSSEDDDGPRPLPLPAPAAKRRKTRRASQDAALDAQLARLLPSAAMYERSYLHRERVTLVAVARGPQVAATASRDGRVKLWKKLARGVAFAKQFAAHAGPVAALAASPDGLRLASAGAEDRTLKLFDVAAFDLAHMLTLDFSPSHCCWVSSGAAGDARIAVADRDAPVLRVFAAEQTDARPLQVIDGLHTAPVTAMAFNARFNCVISADARGHIEYWSAETFRTPSSADGVPLRFKFKGETDLYDLAKAKTSAMSIDVAPDGESFVVAARDRQIRVFRFLTGKLRRKYDESLTVFEDAQADGSLHLDAIDFGRRAAVEREIEASDATSNCIFDDSGRFILYPTLLGIKVVNVETNALVRVLGKVESADRFLQLALFQGKPKVDSQFERQLNKAGGSAPKVMSDNPADAADEIDPTLFCTSFKRSRFFLFSSREPEEDDDGGSGRDVFNEKPTLEESQVATEQSAAKVLGDTAVMHTTMGDITIKLFGKECPKTVENFCTHARNGYYDNLIFHRVIKNFMVQTGDPLGDGTGGESIWGGEFEDEFHRNLRHDRSFTVSMANAGPGTNGSQFFITTVPTPWLDNKHTVFGRVEIGKDTVSNIEQTRTDKLDKPVDDIKIINIDIL